MDDRLRQAVEANAAWCDEVAREAGAATHRDDDRWWSTSRTPPLYPDAMTLRAGVDPETVLEGVDTGDGCSVKDSFADLDLEPFGFAVLFEAQWLHVEGADPEWQRAAYEHGEELDAALRAGAVPLGPLRVWMSPPVGG